MKRIKILLFALWPWFLFSQENIGQVTQGLSVLSNGLWPNKTCEVCWENATASNETERNWVRDAVADTWERESDFRFTGWGNCNAQSRGIRIQIADVGPHAKALGSNLDGMVNGMVLNFSFMNWSTDCASTREYCIKAIGVHEFGHALGFAHEQNRTDAPLDCQLDAQGSLGDWWVTTYDENSIMNYCNPAWNNDGFLSDKDKIGVKFLYGGKLIEDPVIYALDASGKLLWYKHLGYKDGTVNWHPKSGTKVGNGWTNYHAVFSGGLGVIYMIKNNGDLVWYKHAGYANGSSSWYGGNNNVVGSGWGGLRTIGLGGHNPSSISIREEIGLDIKYFNH